MVQQETLPPPVQLSSETVQAIVGLLTQHNACTSYTSAYGQNTDNVWVQMLAFIKAMG